MAQPEKPLPRPTAEADRAAGGEPDGDPGTEAGAAGDTPTREMAAEEGTPTVAVAPRWTGMASPPAENKRVLQPPVGRDPVRPPLSPTLELPATEREDPADQPPVDPWAEHPVADPALSPTIPYPAPPPTQPAPPATRPAPPPAVPSAPPLRQDQPAAPSAGPPPGWRPPPGYVVVVRRRRRWPWVLLALTLLSIACCCGLPAYLGKPIWDQYPATAALPDQVADLRLSDDAASSEKTQRLKLEMRAAHLLAEDTFAGVYTTPEGKEVIVFGVTGFRLDPETDVETEVTRLTPTYGLREVRTVQTGRRGEHVRCGVGQDDGESIVACTWADHGSLGTALFTRLSVDDSARLLATLRSSILIRE